jgi:hypothetical protein
MVKNIAYKRAAENVDRQKPISPRRREVKPVIDDAERRDPNPDSTYIGHPSCLTGYYRIGTLYIHYERGASWRKR